MAHLLSESNYRKRFRQFDCSINPTVFQEILKIFRFAQFRIVFFGKYAQFLFRKCFPIYREIAYDKQSCAASFSFVL